MISFLLFVLPFAFHVLGQNASAYPDWVSNDYNCVIGCLQGFNSSMTTIPNTALETSSLGCVADTCNNATYAGNIYQAQYIISMFYSTGSIYESTSSSSSSASITSTAFPTESLASSSEAGVGTTSEASLGGTIVATSGSKTSSSEVSPSATRNNSGNATSWGTPSLDPHGVIFTLGSADLALVLGLIGSVFLL